ncbi:hypothetical protein KEJ18_01075 [Candidatus Bathyarchaeota archaeon]|nr:hypothetical protein [Candidatus Bathyarchaeota archaeon]
MEKMSETKVDILELLWVNDGPLNSKQIVDKLGLKPRAANMHLMGLVKNGFIAKNVDNEYTITPSGRVALGFPATDEKLARKILSKTLKEKAFYFYKGIGQPTGITADSLNDFCEKLKTLDTKIIEFHTERGDFEAWVSSLGDLELAKRLKVIRGTNLSGELLRKKTYESVKSRCEELSKAK